MLVAGKRWGCPVIRISIPWMIEVVAALDRLDTIQEGQKFLDAWYLLYDAQRQVASAFDGSVYSGALKVSRQKGAELRALINSLIGDESRVVSRYDTWAIRSMRDQFKTIFLAEVSALPAYLVSAKEGYDVDVLISAGTRLFPQSMLSKAPETHSDAMEAGKALAFEVATGAGFHAFRVVEAVARRYWDKVSDGAERPEPQTIGRFAAELEQKTLGDVKIVESLKQMTKLHRNPIAHEVILTVEEAIGIVGMARSVVGAMLAVLPDVPPTTVSASAFETDFESIPD